MKCQECKCERLYTYKTRDNKYCTVRYKKCLKCGKKYKSIETLCIDYEEKEKKNED